jgi:hypothetical protein
MHAVFATAANNAMRKIRIKADVSEKVRARVVAVALFFYDYFRVEA